MRDDLKEMMIYTAIDNLIAYIDSCKTLNFTGGGSKRVDVDEINDLISAITVNIPEEMRRAQSIIAEADNILDSAQNRAEELVKQANISAGGIRERAKSEAERTIRAAELERDRMLDEHQITLQAKRDADQMIEATQKACRDTYEHAQIETSELLDEVERCLHGCVKAVHSERDRVGVRKMQTRYEPAYEDEEGYDSTDEPTQAESEAFTDKPSDSDTEDDFSFDKPVVEKSAETTEQPFKQKKSKGTKISAFAKKLFYDDDDEQNIFSDDESFDSDEDIDL